MRIYVPSMPELFTWLDACGYRYVVLRSFLGLAEAYPPIGSKQDIDILVDNDAIGAIRVKYGRYGRRNGVKCDFYHASAAHDGGYLGAADFPPELAEKMLSRRRLWCDRFYVPSARDHYDSLLYTIAYHKAEQSGISAYDPAQSHATKYAAELSGLEEELGQSLPRCLSAYHASLTETGYGISYDRLARNIGNNFLRGRQSEFLNTLCRDKAGELSLVLIGNALVSRGKLDFVLSYLRQDTKVIDVKQLSFRQRMRIHLSPGRRLMRGVRVAVIVRADEKGIAADLAIKMRNYLSWATGTRPSTWPLFATDDEVETLGLLPLFLTERERMMVHAQR